ncbi:MAG: tetratricopeptide repeat protein, partial [Armatimonadetes bacterium]|nr:tetratricopeptide repeat protein [Anaerolineae bacterium]
AWFALQIDPAYGRYLASLNGDLDSRLSDARAAVQQDPALRLYPLHVAYLLGVQADSTTAISAYQAALVLEPTWDVGWMNLGALYLRQGDPDAAYAALTEAQRINPLTLAPLNRAMVAEQYALLPRSPIISIYTLALANAYGGVVPAQFPAFWEATALRRAALELYLADADPQVAVMALPGLRPGGEFAAVLYGGRGAIFSLLPILEPPTAP